ncbi:ABC transporter permease [Maribellus maritimus]|uniref:ABC transporter permease n=1 Tax=Maribellus maritimus TaxID=2870838 RepID=UPI001EECC375|nr:FtsX-like permease family protein [Maribellus maritimus]MCG6189816.1 FtsX-like permease family protein [Maribellus maritimus]
MLKYNLIILLRNLKKKPVYSTISVAGFTFGIVASLFIWFWVLDELSFEKFHPEHQQIYRVLTLSKQGDNIVKSASSYEAIASTLKMDYPQIEDATYISYSSEDSPLKVEGSTNKIESRRAWVDNQFFNVFQGFEFLEGTRKNALDNPNKIILSEKTAQKLFGSEPALGKTLISDKWSWDEVYTVGGVVRIPQQSHIDFGYLLSENGGKMPVKYSNNWHKSVHVHTYIKLQKNAEINENFKDLVSGHIGKYTNSTDKLLFQPIVDIHLHTDYETYQYDKNISNIKYIWIFSGLALLIILMASLNFASLSAARASKRATEIGVRKVSGSNKKSLVKQFIMESLAQTVFATIIALFIVGLFLPWFGNLTSKEFSFSFTPQLIPSLFIITLLVGIFAGIYPAFYLTSFNPVLIFKGGNPTGSKAGFTRGLVLVQFTIATVLIVSGITVYKQLQFIQNRDLGIDKKNIVVVPTGLWYSIKNFKQELLENPNIISVSASAQAPVDYGWQRGFWWDGIDKQDTLQANMLWVDEDFAKTYNLKMIKGDFLKFNYSDYWSESGKANKSKKEGKEYTFSIPVVVNQTFVKMMGVDNPIGMRLNNSNVIIGVVKDFNYRSLYNKIGPLVLQNSPEAIQTLNVKISPVNRAATLNFIRDTYKKHRNERGFSYSYFEDELEQVYKAETRLGSLIFIFGLVAVSIAVMGILGLSVFATERRVKEIGIRKVNGAKFSEIMALLNLDFIKWVTVAFFIAAPISFLLMNNWLQNFAYKTRLSWWVFALAGLLALGIALLTVSWQSWKAATRNPVEALRYE